MKLSAILAPLVAAKADHETILQVVLAYEAEQGDALERRRESDRLRQAAKAARDSRSRDSREAHVTASSHGGVTPVEDKTSNSEIEPQEENKKRANALSPEFEEFWTAYPNKVGKPKALASFNAARKRAPHTAIMAGLQRYVASKPVDRPWLNPTTFLNQDRWADMPATVTPTARGSPGPAPPQLADVFAFIGKRQAANGQEREDSGGIPPAVPHLPAVGSG